MFASVCSQDTLRTIWGLSDKNEPRGTLTEDEFLVACKLVAVAQAGRDVVPGAETGNAPLPRFSGIARPGAVDDDEDEDEDEDDDDDESGVCGGVNRLGLDADAVAYYARLWALAEPTDSYLQPGAAVAFLSKSGLGQVSKQASELNSNRLFCPLFSASCLLQPVSHPAPSSYLCTRAPGSAFDMGAPAYDQRQALTDPHPTPRHTHPPPVHHQDTLRLIWSIADAESPRGKLSEREFMVACKLVAVAQGGGEVDVGAEVGKAPLPRFEGVPLPGGGSGRDKTLAAAAAALGLDEAGTAYYATLWVAAGPDGGLLLPGAAVTFLSRSGLGQDTLRTIWGLSDRSPPRGKLSESEFLVACKLVAAAQAGRDVSGVCVCAHVCVCVCVCVAIVCTIITTSNTALSSHM
jgi:hypothetical protein